MSKEDEEVEFEEFWSERRENILRKIKKNERKSSISNI